MSTLKRFVTSGKASEPPTKRVCPDTPQKPEPSHNLETPQKHLPEPSIILTPPEASTEQLRDFAGTSSFPLSPPESPTRPSLSIRTQPIDRTDAKNRAKVSLRTSTPAEYCMSGRTEEYDKINSFLRHQFLLDSSKPFTSGTMLVLGQPGGGKTALVRHCTSLYSGPKVTLHYENCSSLAHGQKELYEKLKKAIGRKKAQAHVIILDEIDALRTPGSKAFISDKRLLKLLEPCKASQNNMCIIGIANLLDLESGIADFWASDITARPEFVHFRPYTPEDLVRILESRVENGVFSQEAISFAAKKIAPLSADARDLINIARHALTMADIKTRPGTPFTEVSFIHMLEAFKSSALNKESLSARVQALHDRARLSLAYVLRAIKHLGPQVSLTDAWSFAQKAMGNNLINIHPFDFRQYCTNALSEKCLITLTGASSPASSPMKKSPTVRKSAADTDLFVDLGVGIEMDKLINALSNYKGGSDITRDACRRLLA